MKIVFVSNALDHIQIPLCDAWEKLTDGNFTYVATAAASAIRSNITAADVNKSRNYVLRPYESEQQKKLAMQAIAQADAVILGTAPESYIVDRLKEGKLTFRYMERLYKTPFTWKNTVRRVIGALLHHTRFQSSPLHLLCAGAYAAADQEMFRNYRNKRYVWGYFPAFSPVNIEDLLDEKRKNETVELIWVGRFVALKHPEQVVMLGKHLKEKGYRFHISMVGYGEMEAQCRELVQEYALQEHIDILGSRTPEQVRQLMYQAHILLFTSDRQEGWGAVVNEGMNSGCAVIASAQAGVSPYLVEHQVSGYLYDCAKPSSLYDKAEQLVADMQKREAFARAAYETIERFWNPENAAKSFLALVDSIARKGENPITQGPGSNAPVLKDGWFCE